MPYENSEGGSPAKGSGPGGAGKHPEARTTGRDPLWPSPLSCTLRKNPQAKRRRLVAPAAASISRAGNFARCTKSKSPLGMAFGLESVTAGLALKPRGWFDAQRVCNALLGGGAGLCRANSGVVTALGQLLSYS
jgi:hypothetical protein